MYRLIRQAHTEEILWKIKMRFSNEADNFKSTGQLLVFEPLIFSQVINIFII